MRGGAPPQHAATDRSPVWTGAATALPVRALSAAAVLAIVVAALLATALRSSSPGAGPTSRPPAPARFAAASSLQARFTSSGAHLRAGAMNVSLRLSRVSGRGATQALPAVAPVRRRNATEYSRPGIAEWYVDSARGLEQGFTIARPPRVVSPGGHIELFVQVGGNAHLSMSRSRASVILTGPTGARLLYGQLHASDANGRNLAGRLSLRGHDIVIGVDAAGARYPLRIDPLVQDGAALTGGEQESGPAQFGYSVAVSADGTTALVGAPRDNPAVGAVWVFVRAGGGWLQQGPPLNGGAQTAEQEACEAEPEEVSDCGFGASVAVSADGNTAIVGSPITTEPCSEPAGVCVGQGAAWVYVRSGATWTREGAPLTGGSEETPFGRFGRSVALSADGNTALVAGPGDHAHHGAVWTFVRSGSTWTQLGPKVALGREGREDYFGLGLALSADGGTALIGGPGNGASRGAAWAYARSASGWTQEGAKLTGGAEEVGAAHFGRSVALSADGSLALIGGFADNGHVGAAWVFSRSASAWEQQGPKLTGGSEAAGPGLFGRSVALSSDGSSALVGAPGDSGKGGAAWAFTRTGAVWGQSGKKLQPSEVVGKAWFGYAVSLSALGEVALIGAPNDAAEVGAAWGYAEGSEPTPEPEPSPVEEPPRKKKAKEPPPEQPQNGQPAPASGGDLGLPAGGIGGSDVLPFGPARLAAKCAASATSRAITVNAKSRASLRLRLAGSGTCRGRVRLAIKKALAHHRPKLVTIAAASFSLSAGRTVSLSLALNKLGRALLRSGHGRLKATLTVVRLYPAPTSARTASVSLSLAHKSAGKR
jgi:FG-GAP repeat